MNAVRSRTESSWTTLRHRTEPIVLAMDVTAVFRAFGLVEQARAQREQLHEQASNARAADVNELAMLALQIAQLAQDDQRDYLAAFQRAAGTVFRENGILAPVHAIDTSGDTSGLFQYDNPFIERLARLARTHTPLPMTGRPAGAHPGCIAAWLTDAHLDYRSRAVSARTQHREGQA